MSDVRAKLAEALRGHRPDGIGFCLATGCKWRHWPECDFATHLADVLLSLEGVAIVAVPEGAFVTVQYDRDALIAIRNATEAAEAADGAEAVKQ